MRSLFVVADDYGIGPETSRGILDVARAGRLTATVLLTNTAYCETAVEEWHHAKCPMAIGWHPNLTLDSPILPPDQVPSLVQPNGRFWPLGKFMMRAFLGRLKKHEVAAELRAQHLRFQELIGHPPQLVNSHQHVSIFQPVGDALLEILANQSGPKPYLRRVGEQMRLLMGIRGARLKRTVLSYFGRRHSKRAAARGLLGAQWLVGVTDPPITTDPHFYTRWLRKVRGETVEIGCHPGYLDETLLVRDVPGHKHDLTRRVNEMNMLLSPDFMKAIAEAGFHLVPPSYFRPLRLAHAA